MSSSRLLCWSGLASLLSAILLMAFGDMGAMGDSEMPDTRYAAMRACALALILLALVGLAQWYAQQLEKGSHLGWIGLGLIFFEAILLGSNFFVESYTVPALASGASDLAGYSENGLLFAGPLATEAVEISILGVLGLVVLAIAGQAVNQEPQPVRQA